MWNILNNILPQQEVHSPSAWSKAAVAFDPTEPVVNQDRDPVAAKMSHSLVERIALPEPPSRVRERRSSPTHQSTRIDGHG